MIALNAAQACDAWLKAAGAALAARPGHPGAGRDAVLWRGDRPDAAGRGSIISMPGAALKRPEFASLYRLRWAEFQQCLR